VQRYGAGIVVPPEQPDSLATAIADLRDNPELQARLQNGSRRLAQDYDRAKFAGDMLREIELAIGSRRNA